MTQLPDSVYTYSYDSYVQLLKFYDNALAKQDAIEAVEVVTDDDYPVEGTFIGTPSV